MYSSDGGNPELLSRTEAIVAGGEGYPRFPAGVQVLS